MISALKEHSACSLLTVFNLNLWAQFWVLLKLIFAILWAYFQKEKTAIKLQSKKHDVELFSEMGD